MGTKVIFGFVNVAVSNRNPLGDERWYETRAERNTALAAFRANAVRRGLSESASISGIYPVDEKRRRVADRLGANALDDMLADATLDSENA